ncbi:MAG: sugar phosphate isomerase/epimerase [Clostridia bacterium]|nr:sugar phosphate isomerase/epimerase [Clostridia bacterium]
MRKLGICTATLKKGDINDFFSIIKNIGFEACFTEAFESEIKAAIKAGIEIDNTHSPFDGINNMWVEGEPGETMLRRLKDSIDLCAAYDIKKTVIHLSSGYHPPRMNDLGFARYDALVEHAIKKGVTLAFENQRLLANIAYVFEQYKDVPEVAFCWDTGHEICAAGGREYMPLFGHRLACVHLEDNHGSEGPHPDQHILPFDGIVDWKKAAQRIKNSPYNGPVILECYNHPGSITNYFGYDHLSDEAFYERAYDAAARIRDLIEKA